MTLPQRIPFIVLAVAVACAPAPPRESVGAPPSQSSSTPSAALSAPPAAVASHTSSSATREPVPVDSTPTVQEPPTDVVPAPDPLAVNAAPFEAGLEEILDARPIRLTKRALEVIKPEAERLAASAKALAPKAKGRSKAHAGAAAVFEELAYALRRELAKTPVTTELAADLQARRKAAEDAALELYFDAIAMDNTLDDAKYRAAHLLHVRRNVVSARKQYFVLVENHPNSAFVPLAYLGFALLFADEARRDNAKWSFVEMSAQKALEPQGNPATPEALLLIARAQRGTGKNSEFAETLGRLRKEFPTSAAAKRKP